MNFRQVGMAIFLASCPLFAEHAVDEPRVRPAPVVERSDGAIGMLIGNPPLGPGNRRWNVTHCTATRLSRTVVITLGECVGDGRVHTFRLNGRSYNLDCTRHPGYVDDAFDRENNLGLCRLTDREPPAGPVACLTNRFQNGGNGMVFRRGSDQTGDIRTHYNVRVSRERGATGESFLSARDYDSYASRPDSYSGIFAPAVDPNEGRTRPARGGAWGYERAGGRQLMIAGLTSGLGGNYRVNAVDLTGENARRFLASWQRRNRIADADRVCGLGRGASWDRAVLNGSVEAREGLADIPAGAPHQELRGLARGTVTHNGATGAAIIQLDNASRRIGLAAGDVITAVNGERVEDGAAANALITAAGNETVYLRVYRRGATPSSRTIAFTRVASDNFVPAESRMELRAR